jgi:hypothetical protein
MDVLFERKISARKFHTTEVDEFEEVVDEKIIHKFAEEAATDHAESKA